MCGCIGIQRCILQNYDMHTAIKFRIQSSKTFESTIMISMKYFNFKGVILQVVCNFRTELIVKIAVLTFRSNFRIQKEKRE